MIANRLTVVATSPHPSIQPRFYVLWPNGAVCAMTGQQFLAANTFESSPCDRHECVAHFGVHRPVGLPACTDHRVRTPAQLEKFAKTHHALVMTKDGLPKPELRCPACQRWHDTPCPESTAKPETA